MNEATVDLAIRALRLSALGAANASSLGGLNEPTVKAMFRRLDNDLERISELHEKEIEAAAKPTWRPIATAPTDGTEILAGVNAAGELVVHIAFYRSAEEIETYGGMSNDFTAEDVGWWSYTENSVGQSMVYPEYWMPHPGKLP